MPAPPRPTGLLHHAAFLDHDGGPGHPERPERAEAVVRRLRAAGLGLDEREPTEAPREWLLLAHTEEHVARVEAACAQAPARLDSDTAVSAGSLRAARLAVGAAVEACERVLAGEWANAFVAARPPGHHAESARAMGFCLFDQVAVAAARLVAEHGLARVAVVDWDVHHGNGTQEIFWSRGDVHYSSVHQSPLYPGSGAASERGVGEGDGATLNAPVPPGSGEDAWVRAFEERVLPALDDFAPEFVLISAGFDAHRADPLAQCELESESFARLTRLVRDVADRHAQGRVVSVLEGGYDLDALAESAEAHVRALR